MQNKSQQSPQQPSNPMLIFHMECKDKNLKKSALESVATISLSLGRKRTRQQLIPYMSNLFVEENPEIQKLILKGFSQLLHPIYIGKSHHCISILEIIMDIICVYPNKDIRDQAYSCLDKVFASIDVRKAQNILVQALKRLNKEQDQNIRQLVLRMIPYVYAGADGEKQKELRQILNSFKEKPSDQKILSQNLTDFIKVMPPVPQNQIRQIITLLLNTGEKNILANLIEPVILLAKVSGSDSTIQYLKKILHEPDELIISTALKKFQSLAEVFQEDHLSVLIEKIKTYDSQPQQIKNTILQILQTLPLSEQQNIKLCQPPSSLQLKTTLSETLCRVSDTKSLLKLFNSSDPNFQVKLFPKLPPVSQMHIEIVQKIMGSKSWRQKLTILQNIDARTQKMEKTQILIPKIAESFSDKISCVRVASGQSIKNIMIKNNIKIARISAILQSKLASKNWFERQCIYRLLLDVLKQNSQYKQQKQQIVQILRMQAQQKVVNNKSIIDQIWSIMQQKQ